MAPPIGTESDTYFIQKFHFDVEHSNGSKEDTYRADALRNNENKKNYKEQCAV